MKIADLRLRQRDGVTCGPSVAVMAGALLRHGARPDPDEPPTLDDTTTRVVWGRYPVRFEW